MKKTQIDILAQEKRIDLSLKNVDLAMELLKDTIAKGTKMHDQLITSQPRTIKMDKVSAIIAMLSTTAKEARSQYSNAQACLNGVAFIIQTGLSNAGNISQYEELKKLRTKTTNAKKELKGYSINAMENLAYKTIERITKAMSSHYPTRVK